MGRSSATLVMGGSLGAWVASRHGHVCGCGLHGRPRAFERAPRRRARPGRAGRPARSVGVLLGPAQRLVVLDARPGPASLPVRGAHAVAAHDVAPAARSGSVTGSSCPAPGCSPRAGACSWRAGGHRRGCRRGRRVRPARGRAALARRPGTRSTAGCWRAAASRSRDGRRRRRRRAHPARARPRTGLHPGRGRRRGRPAARGSRAVRFRRRADRWTSPAQPQSRPSHRTARRRCPRSCCGTPPAGSRPGPWCARCTHPDRRQPRRGAGARRDARAPRCSPALDLADARVLAARRAAA